MALTPRHVTVDDFRECTVPLVTWPQIVVRDPIAQTVSLCGLVLSSPGRLRLIKIRCDPAGLIGEGLHIPYINQR